MSFMRRKNRRNRRISRCERLRGEALEPRHLLAANPVISEFLADNDDTLGDGDGNSSDWIELYNAGNMEIDLAGWHLTDDPLQLNKWTFPSLTLGPAGYVVVFASNQPVADYVDASGYLHTNFSLNVEGEYVALVQPDGLTIASEFGAAGMAYPRQFEDVSYGEQFIGGGPRYFGTPTPGLGNRTLAINNSGPPIGSVAHSPLRPGADEDLIVSAEIASPASGVESVMLTYRVMYGEETTVDMVDDGISADAVADDGVYTAAIPASAYESGQMVRYFVSTRDSSDNPARKPEHFRPLESAQYFGTVVADPTIPATQLPILEWFVEDPTWHRTPGGNNRDIAMASMFYDGQFYDNVQVRVRGGVTQNQIKPNLKFDFYNGGRFLHSADLPAVEEFNLESLYGEIPTRTYMREPLAYQVFRDSGHATPLSFYLHVRQNGQFYSLASFEEQVDDTFLERNGLDPDGALYDSQSNAKLQPNPTPLQWNKATRENEDFSDLAAFTDGLSLTDPTARERFIFDNVNLPQVIHYLAITLLGPNHDRLTHNYYVYRDTNDTGEWSMMPWDLDRWFPQGDLLTNPVSRTIFYGDSDHPRYPGTPTDRFNHLNDAVFDTPRSREMFLTHLRSVVDQWMGAGPSYLEQTIDVFEELIALDAALDHAKWGGGTLAAGVASIKSSIATRRSHLVQDNNIPPAFTGAIQFGEVEWNPASGDQDEEYIALFNPNRKAVDISGWRLSGGVEHTFQPGTVIAAADTLFVSPDVAAFRNRATGPSGGQALFVQGDYAGHISNFGETIDLLDHEGNLVTAITTPNEASPSQRFLRVSEIMYHPHDPPAGSPYDDNDFEFIELINTGAEPLDLSGVTFDNGIQFDFTDSAIAALEPGERLILVSNAPAFVSRYGAELPVAGQYDGMLSNSGERIELSDPQGATILDFQYDDAWQPSTDGGGHSLVIVDAAADRDSWSDPASWRASAAPGGTPGAAEAEPLEGDTNRDGRVDLDDLNNVRNHFGDAGAGVAGDTNGDGVVNIDDLNAVRNNFGSSSLALHGGAAARPTIHNAHRVDRGQPGRNGQTAEQSVLTQAELFSAARDRERLARITAVNRPNAQRSAWDQAILNWLVINDPESERDRLAKDQLHAARI